MKRNPKQEGSNLYDCVVQSGKCPRKCNQCFFNRPGAFYCETPTIPSLDEIGTGGIVRMNCGHDSNFEREKVIAVAANYEDAFFNTSIARFNFPGPVVYTANSREEEPANLFEHPVFRNLMFVRLRVSSTNLVHIDQAVDWYVKKQVPVVLTFMAYYDACPNKRFYEWKVRHVNSYWCPKDSFVESVMKRYPYDFLVSLCDNWCKDCRNCETYYLQTKKRLCDVRKH